MKTSDVLNKLEEYAPLEISRAFVAAGAYDNSGLLVDTGEPVKKPLLPWSFRPPRSHLQKKRAAT